MKEQRGVPRAIVAVVGHDHEELRRAIADGDDLEKADRDGRTALHHAAIDGDRDAVAALLQAGAIVRTSDRSKWTPLHCAAAEHHLGVAEMLISAGADVEAEDVFGNTPLWRAVFVSRGRGEMIQLLRKYGADILHSNRSGVSPLSLATTIANYDVARWLR